MQVRSQRHSFSLFFSIFIGQSTNMLTQVEPVCNKNTHKTVLPSIQQPSNASHPKQSHLSFYSILHKQSKYREYNKFKHSRQQHLPTVTLILYEYHRLIVIYNHCLSNIIWRMLRKYFQDYESEEDEDYNPTKLEEAIYRQEQQKKKKKGLTGTSAQQLYQEAKEEYYLSLQKKVKTDQQQPNTLELAQSILSSDSIKPNKRVVFAGKEFILNEETGQLEIIQKKLNYQIQEQHHTQQNAEQFQHRKTHIAYQYLNHVMRAIYNRSRKINSVGKSKLDWKGFVRQEGIEDKLKYNRKGGVIENMQFMKKANNLTTTS